MKAIDDLDWQGISRSLDSEGWAVIGGLLTRAECHAMTSLYGRDDQFRSTVTMARHGFGRGEYRYFAYPLSPLVAALRAALYPQLAPVANRWNEALKNDIRFPPNLCAFLKRCHDAGQTRP